MRRTDLCTLVRTFQAGQSIRAQDLNNAFLQQLYLHQEMYEFISEQFFDGGDLVLDGLASLGDTYWDKTDETISTGETWVGGDAHVATTGAIDNRINAKITASEGDQNLQAVTNRGNTTTTSIRAASLETGNTLLPATTTLNADGTASFCSGNAVINISGEMTLNSDINIRNVDYTWPSSAGAAGTVLSTTGNGELVWTAPAGEADTLQAVCDRGNTTTTGASFGAGNITLNADGSGEFALSVQVGGSPFDSGGTQTGSILGANGRLTLAVPNDGDTFLSLKRTGDTGSNAVKASIFGDGSATFAGKLTSASTASGDGGTTLTTKDYVDSLPSGGVTQITAGTGVTISPTSGVGNVTINATGGSEVTNLGIANRGATTLDVTSSSGTNATLPAVSTTQAGLMTAADKVILDGVGNPLLYQGTVNLTSATVPGSPQPGWTYANTVSGTVSAEWAAVSTLSSSASVNTGDLVVYNGTEFTHIPTGGNGITQNLQQVTDVGNTTTNGAKFANDAEITASGIFRAGPRGGAFQADYSLKTSSTNVAHGLFIGTADLDVSTTANSNATILGDGSATFNADVVRGTYAANSNYVALRNGQLEIGRNTTLDVVTFIVGTRYNNGVAEENFKITANGNATFAGNVIAGGNPSFAIKVLVFRLMVLLMFHGHPAQTFGLLTPTQVRQLQISHQMAKLLSGKLAKAHSLVLKT